MSRASGSVALLSSSLKDLEIRGRGQYGYIERKIKRKLGSHFFSLIQHTFIGHLRNYIASQEKRRELQPGLPWNL